MTNLGNRATLLSFFGVEVTGIVNEEGTPRLTARLRTMVVAPSSLIVTLAWASLRKVPGRLVPSGIVMTFWTDMISPSPISNSPNMAYYIRQYPVGSWVNG